MFSHAGQRTSCVLGNVGSDRTSRRMIVFSLALCLTCITHPIEFDSLQEIPDFVDIDTVFFFWNRSFITTVFTLVDELLLLWDFFRVQ